MARFHYYRKRGREKRYRNFYCSRPWRKLRLVVLEENPFCVFCDSLGETKIAKVVDHIIPIVDDWEKRLDIDNLRPLCKECHDNLSHLARRSLPPRTFPDGSPNPDFKRMWNLFISQQGDYHT